RSRAGNQNVFTDQIEGQRRVHRIAERIEDRGDIIGNFIGNREHIGCGQGQIFSKAAGPVNAYAERVAAKVPLARTAVTTYAADNMALAGYALAFFQMCDLA